eukprot:1446787-Rhodomonas_salina.1
MSSEALQVVLDVIVVVLDIETVCSLRLDFLEVASALLGEVHNVLLPLLCRVVVVLGLIN